MYRICSAESISSRCAGIAGYGNLARVLRCLRAWNVSWARSVGSITLHPKEQVPRSRWSLNWADETANRRDHRWGDKRANHFYVDAGQSSLWGCVLAQKHGYIDLVTCRRRWWTMDVPNAKEILNILFTGRSEVDVICWQS